MNCLPVEANWLAEVNSLAQAKAQHLVRQRTQSSLVLNSLLTTILVCSSLSVSPESCPGKLQHARYAQKRGNPVQPERPVHAGMPPTQSACDKFDSKCSFLQ